MCGIEQIIRSCIIYRSKPFAFKNAPKYLCYIQFRRVRRKVEQEESSTFPYLSEFFDFPIPMNRGIVQNYHGFLLDCKGHGIKIFYDLVSID